MTAPLLSPAGLSNAEARRRLEKHGPNRLVPARTKPAAVAWLLRALADPMTLLLLAAGPTYLALGDTVSAAVAFGAIVPLAGAGFVLETRAEHALAELARLTAPTARVQRDGQLAEIPGEEVVPGDLLEVREGDVVAADGRIVDVAQLSVDEASLTGESHPVAKATGTDDADDRVLAGTTVVSGRALVRVETTGAATEYGRVGALVEASQPPPTPLQRIVRRLVVRLGAFIVGFCVAVAGVQLLHGSGWAAALLAALSLAIATVPEELPIVYTLYLALGARRLARERALVRRLVAVETLGATTVICTDKTGTLTLGRVAVGTVVTADGRRHGDEPLDDGARRVLETAVLASEPAPFDPLDRALVEAARERGVDVDRLHGRTLVCDYAFDPQAKYLSHVWRDGRDRLSIAAKGAVEGMLERTDPSLEVRRSVAAANAALAADGMRVIAVAGGALDTSKGRAHDEEVLELVGLIGFRDPLRPGVAEAVRACTEAGVRIVMVTGDHPVTAHAVAEGIDLPHDDDHVATGADLDGADGEALRRVVRDTAIFARTRPEQKHLLVEALQAEGEVVAMTGDGINDAPALRRADIGVAMGGRGTEVAREAATMVLLDDNFATLVVAIREGRRIFDNLRTAFAYLVAFHVPLLAAALLIPFTGEPLLLLPAHLILLQIVGHPTAALAFEGDRPAADVMRRPPRPPRSPLLSRGALIRSLVVGATLGVAVLAVYLVRIESGALAREARASAFVTLLGGEVLLVLVVRARGEPFWRVGARGNRSLWAVVAVTIGMVVATLALPPARELLRLGPLEAGDVAIAVGAAVVATAWTGVVAAARGRKSLWRRTVGPT